MLLIPLRINYHFNQLLKELENHKEKDFFFFIHTWKVHAPYFSNYYLEKERLSEEVLFYMKHPYKLPKDNRSLTLRYRKFLEQNNLYNLNDCVDMYDGGIHYVDQYIGKLIDKSKATWHL